MTFKGLFWQHFTTTDENQFVRQQKAIFCNPAFELQCPWTLSHVTTLGTIATGYVFCSCQNNGLKTVSYPFFFSSPQAKTAKKCKRHLIKPPVYLPYFYPKCKFKFNAFLRLIMPPPQIWSWPPRATIKTQYGM